MKFADKDAEDIHDVLEHVQGNHHNTDINTKKFQNALHHGHGASYASTAAHEMTLHHYNTMKERPTLLYTSFKKLSGQRRSTRMDDMRVPDPFNTPRDTRPRFKANKKYLLRSMRGTQHLQRSSTAPSGVFSEATLGPKFNVKLESNKRSTSHELFYSKQHWHCRNWAARWY